MQSKRRIAAITYRKRMASLRHRSRNSGHLSVTCSECSPAREGRDFSNASPHVVPLLTQRATKANDFKPSRLFALFAVFYCMVPIEEVRFLASWLQAQAMARIWVEPEFRNQAEQGLEQEGRGDRGAKASASRPSRSSCSLIPDRTRAIGALGGYLRNF